MVDYEQARAGGGGLLHRAHARVDREGDRPRLAAGTGDLHAVVGDVVEPLRLQRAVEPLHDPADVSDYALHLSLPSFSDVCFSPKIAFSTSAAFGAAVTPPPSAFSTTIASATVGFSDGA